MITEIAFITFTATVLSAIFWKLKQPPILAYILAGLLLGPVGFNLIKDSGLISALSDMGIAFLLFLVGLEMDFKKLKEVGRSSILTGVGQIAFTGTIGYIACRFLGLPLMESIYIAIGLSFSSTIIIVKLLSEKGDLDSLYGRIAVGFLLVQDFVAIAILVGLGMLKTGSVEITIIGKTILSAVTLLLAAILSSKYVLPRLFSHIARSQEILFLSSISWAFLFSWFSSFLGFPVEIGAFLAGLAMAPLPYCYEIFGKIKPLRDFFVVLFFVILGMRLNISPQMLRPAVILSAIVLIGNPTIVMTILGLLGYRRRTSFFASLATAQISEFSMILVAMGIELGQISQTASSLITTVALITIAISTYAITFNDKIYDFVSPFLRIFERKKTRMEPRKEKKMKNHIIVFGYHRMGYTIVKELKRMKEKVLVIDFNPDLIKLLKKEKIPYLYGDALDSEVIERSNIEKSKMIVSTIPCLKTNLYLIYKAKSYNKPIIVTTTQLEDARELYRVGADYVIIPHFLGGEKAASIIKEVLKGRKKMVKIKFDHIKHLEKRIKLGHNINKSR